MADNPRVPGPEGDDASGDLGEGKARSQALALMHQHQIITARFVEKPRKLPEVMMNISEAAAAFGERFMYGWEVNDRRTGTKQWIEGLTIQAANALHNAWGNCTHEVLVAETPESWIFSVCFYDLERGTGYTRLFRQRRRQDTGMKDADRREDLVFQIGQSKAIRNCILNALAPQATYLTQEVKKRLVSWVEKNRDAALQTIGEMMHEFNLRQVQIEAMYGRTIEQFTNGDIAAVLKRLRAVHEGWTTVEEAFPSLENAPTIKEEMEQRRATEKTPAATTTAETKTEEPEKKNKGGRPAGSKNKPKEQPQPEGGGAPSSQSQSSPGPQASDDAPAAQETSGGGQPAQQEEDDPFPKSDNVGAEKQESTPAKPAAQRDPTGQQSDFDWLDQ